MPPPLVGDPHVRTSYLQRNWCWAATGWSVIEGLDGGDLFRQVLASNMYKVLPSTFPRWLWVSQSQCLTAGLYLSLSWDTICLLDSPDSKSSRYTWPMCEKSLFSYKNMHLWIFFLLLIYLQCSCSCRKRKTKCKNILDLSVLYKLCITIHLADWNKNYISKKWSK